MKKKTPSISLSDLIKEQLRDKEFRKEWEKSELQYQLVRQIIKMRLKKKVSQRELAEKAKITQAMISRIESGSASPRLETLTKIANGLDSRLTVSLG